MQAMSDTPADAPKGEAVTGRAVLYRSLAWILVLAIVTPLFVSARNYGLVAFLLGFALMLLLIVRGIVHGIRARNWILVGVVVVPVFVVVVIGNIIAISGLLHSHQAANESTAVANLRRISAAEVTYKSMSSSGGRYGALQDLVDARLLDETFTGIKGGYSYAITLDETGSHYKAETVPGRTEWGRYGYYTLPDAVVRYSTNASLAPTAAQVGKPVQQEKVSDRHGTGSHQDSTHSRASWTRLGSNYRVVTMAGAPVSP